MFSKYLNVTFDSVVRLIGMMLSLLSFTYLASNMSAESYGEIRYIISIVTFMAPLIGFSINSAYIKHIELFEKINYLEIFYGLIIVLLNCIVFYHLMMYLEGWDYFNIYVEPFLFTITLMISGFLFVISRFFIVFDKISLFPIFQFLIPQAILFVILYIFFIEPHNNLDVTDFFIIYTACILISCILALFYHKIEWKKLLTLQKYTPSYSFKKIFKSGVSISTISLSTAIGNAYVVFFLNKKFGSEFIGFYVLLLSWVALIYVFITMYNSRNAKFYSIASKEGGFKEILKSIKKVSIFSVIYYSSIAIVYSFAFETYIPLINNEYLMYFNIGYTAILFSFSGLLITIILPIMYYSKTPIIPLFLNSIVFVITLIFSNVYKSNDPAEFLVYFSLINFAIFIFFLVDLLRKERGISCV